MRSYEIRLTTTGFDNTTKTLAKMGPILDKIEGKLSKIGSSASGIDAVTAKMNRLANALERVAAAAAGIKGSGAVGITTPKSGGSSPAARAAKVSGPYQKLNAARDALAAAQAAGDPHAVNDANYNIRLKERAIFLDQQRKGKPQDGPGLLELFTQLNQLMGKLSRGDVAGSVITLGKLSQGRNTGGGVNIAQMAAYGIGGTPAAGAAAAGTPAASGLSASVSSLIGGVARFAGPIGVLAGAVGVVKAFNDAANAARVTLLSIGGSASASGSSPANIAALRGLGFTGDVAGTGASLRSKMSSDPFAMAIGGYQLPGHLTGAPNAPLVEKQMQGLARLYQEGRLTEAIRRSRVLGLEAELKTVMLSRNQMSYMKTDAEFLKTIYTPQQAESARDYEAALKRVSTNWDAVQVRMFGGTFEQGKTNFLNNIAHFLQWGITDSKHNAKNGRAQTAEEKLVSSLDALNATLRDVVGGGPRAQGALSPAQRAAAQRGANLNSLRDLGAFRL